MFIPVHPNYPALHILLYCKEVHHIYNLKKMKWYNTHSCWNSSYSHLPLCCQMVLHVPWQQKISLNFKPNKSFLYIEINNVVKVNQGRFELSYTIGT
ncbi:hypothetical protein FKM82_010299 [Ascaphus truei]